jgi:hypothetical protein
MIEIHHIVREVLTAVSARLAFQFSENFLIAFNSSASPLGELEQVFPTVLLDRVPLSPGRR